MIESLDSAKALGEYFMPELDEIIDDLLLLVGERRENFRPFAGRIS